MRRIRLYPLQYISVLAAVFILSFLEVNIQTLKSGLLTIFFLLILTIASLLGDASTGILSIIACTVSVDYVIPRQGFKLDSDSLFRLLEFFVAALIIFWLAQRTKRLNKSNTELSNATKSLNKVIGKLKRETSGNKREIAKLDKLNKELANLVDEFIDDDKHWDYKWRK